MAGTADTWTVGAAEAAWVLLGGTGTASPEWGEEGGDGGDGDGEHGECVDNEGERLGTIEIVRGEPC